MGAGTELVNQVYNGDFLLVQEAQPDFPDGWQKTGGDLMTAWEWLGPPEGPRALLIHHPGGPKAGIWQTVDVALQGGDMQRWEVQVTLETNPAGIPGYLKVYTGAGGIQIFTLTPGAGPQVFSRVLATQSGVPGLRLEIGVLGLGDLTIHQVQAYRLFPLRALKLDEKGQVYVRHVESLGQIQMPVSVKIVSPVPIPVDARGTLPSNIRDLTPARDAVRIYASGGTPLASTYDGLMQIQICGHSYQESPESVTAVASPKVTMLRDVATLSVYSFAVINIGTVSSFVQLEVSPDGANWLADGPEHEVTVGGMVIFTPTCFLRFNRLKYRAALANPLTVWFQAQS